ncbi:hypothetical protein [Psychromarinibacter sp. S121]|uniref:hypothetical protein n=1 Tax=Psychromarinibacter sp. S121 TaxID=3415127 RepID=UPI003C7E8F6E
MKQQDFFFPPKHTNSPHKRVVFYDRPMGTGKTQRLLRGFDPNTKYLVVHEFLSQVDEVLENAAGVPFETPKEAYGRTRGGHLETLIRQGKNVVTTHALFPRLVDLAREGWLAEYAIVIDETLDPLKTPSGPNKGTWQSLVNDGWATVEDTGRVVPTSKWIDDPKDVDDSLTPELLAAALSGRLYVTQKRHMFILPIPVELLTCGNSTTVMTYMAQGSTLTGYLDRLGVDYVVNRDILEEAKLRNEIRRWVELRDIPALKGMRWSYSKQIKMAPSATRRVQNALKNLRGRQLRGTALDKIMIGCAKDNWIEEGGHGAKKKRPGKFARNSKMFEANWVAPGVRGVNKYRHCSVVISLYDYHLHPAILEWLGKEADNDFKDRYAVSELLQFIYRSRIRCRSSIDYPTITLFLPSERMRNLFLEWVNQDALPGEELTLTR